VGFKEGKWVDPYQVILQPEALDAMDETFTRLYAENPEHARQWVTEIWEAVRELGIFPGHISSASESGYFEVRIQDASRILGNRLYRILFTLVSSDTVSVVSFRHSTLPEEAPS
jgi:plasmid stabilization system protein ParE